MHEALDAEPGGGVGVAKLLGEGALVLELQAVVLALGDQMEAVAHPPQIALAVTQPAPLLAGEDAEAFQFGGVHRAVLAPANPKHGLQVAQAAGSVLDVGLEIGLHVLETRMAPLLLRPLGLEIAVGRPSARMVDEGVELVNQPPQRRALQFGEQPPLEQCRGHREVGLNGGLAFRQVSDAVADFEIQVKQRPHEGFDFGSVLRWLYA